MKPDRELLSSIDAETEAIVVGTILRDGESAYRQVEFLDVEDFGVEIHRIVFRAIRELAAEVRPTIDAVACHLTEFRQLDPKAKLLVKARLH